MIKLKIKYGNSQTVLRFPCTEKEMRAALGRIHAENITPLELYAAEVAFPEELRFLQDRFVDLDEVNFLAKRMDSFFGDEEYRFYEALKSEGFDTLPGLINLSFNLNRYPLIHDISDMGKIGREYLLAVKGCLPADDADDPKYAAFGRKLIQSGKGVFTEHGLLFVDEDTPFERIMMGRTSHRMYMSQRSVFYGRNTMEKPNICTFPVRTKPLIKRLPGSAHPRRTMWNSHGRIIASKVKNGSSASRKSPPRRVFTN